jgi:hypothetical protein
MAQKVNIDGHEYKLDSLSEVARNQVGNLRVADQRIAQLKQELALVQTARAVYAKTLAENLPEPESKPESESAESSV